ncbi:glyoxalase [[Bacillus] enclensis]|uniref:Catechol 2,3-dioxygenase n=2 Tax=Rossellomorea TaxID=2837508 RepID=A0A0V8HJM7_9BACI|nr:glyoxalase [[Bacillus] enclensis]KSU62610.1 glyoxalase [[Bacillus] enclensis]OAT82746.1 glyoxalase [Bacillus sp. MKU004]SCC06918.1 Catechol 2,3-dioxygenase [[Bacillus] enclensis]
MTVTFKGIDHIQLAAPEDCEKEARRFYGEMIGLKEIPKPENLQGRGGCWFQFGSQEVHIGVQQAFVPATKAHPGLLVEGLEEFRSSLIEKGIEIKEDTPINGRCRFFVSDPFGNRIEFLEYN